MRDLPEVLSDGQIETLRDMLAVPYDPRMPGTLIEFNGLKNAAAEFLIQQPAFPSDLLFDFAAMFEDVAYDAVWRDYCLQMLGQGYLGLSGRGGQDASDARSLAVAVLLEATGAHSGTWAGTALLGLYAVMSSDPEAVPAGVFTNEVVKAASDPSASEAVRITALRLAGVCRMAEVRSSALRLAGAAETETLRAAAIATLGEVGKVEDRELLTGFAMEDDPVVSTAAKRACQLLPGKIE